MVAYRGANAARGTAVTLVKVGVAVIVVIGGLGAYYLYAIGNTNSSNPSGTSASITTTDEYGATYVLIANDSYPLTKSIDFVFSVPSSISGVDIPSALLLGNFTTSGSSGVYAYVLTPQQFASWQSGQSFKPVWEECCVFSPSLGSIDVSLPNGTYYLVFDLTTSESTHLTTNVKLYLTNSYFQLLQKMPFGDYATVLSTAFNGTELYFSVKWLSSDFVPLYYQATSAVSDALPSYLCGFVPQNVASGQIIPLVFGVRYPLASIYDVNLLIAVKAVNTGSEFYISSYPPTGLEATNAPIPTTAYYCK